jgi:hypothetical protein
MSDPTNPFQDRSEVMRATADEFPPEVVEAVADAIVQAIPLPKNRALNVLRTLHALGYQRVGPGEVVVPRGAVETLHNALNCVIHEEDNDPPCALTAVWIARNGLDEYRAMLAAAASGDGA